MQLHTIHTGNFMLDGGAMFGVVPKSLWSRHMTADANNLCSWAMRCLLVENGDNLLLVDPASVRSNRKNSSATTTCTATTHLIVSAARGFSRADIRMCCSRTCTSIT